MNDYEAEIWKEITDMGTYTPYTYGSWSTTTTTVTIPDEMIANSGCGSLVYISDGNTYIVTTVDGTTVEIDGNNNCIKVNGYKITTDTIKNAIKKIQEEEEYKHVPSRT